MEKRYNPAQAQERIRAFWAQEEIYRFDPNAPGALYAIDTPPPTVSGSLHIGHIFSYTQAEMIARFRRMEGDNVFYPFGFDDNGLPTERLVEKEHGLRGRDLPRGEFAALCAETAAAYETRFTQLWQRMGFCVDWSQLYNTAGPLAQRISQRSFLDLAQRDRAYCKESPVLWCTQCATSIAQAELETADCETQFLYLPFAVGEETLPVATTRPELLYGCVCLFVHPEDARYRDFLGKTACVPLFGHEVPILAEDTVDMEKGTGAVLCATFGDSTDAAWVEAHKLPYRRVLLPDGTLAPEVPHLGGLTVAKARQAVTALLAEQGLLLKTERLSHTVGTHERCGTPVEILPSRQWYIRVLDEKERFLQAADGINWYPAQMKTRYLRWVENLKWDWCISRQRYFGVPIPVWYCKSCGAAVFARAADLPVNPAEQPYHGSCACGGTDFAPERAVLDTWATSSLTPQINARTGEADERKLFPMTLRAQAHEIIRTWTFYTIVKSLYHTGKLPWRDIMISGFVLAKPGEKISKSKNNAAASPEALLERHSADALRYWAANAKLGTDSYFDEQELAVSKRFLTKLWNAARFALGHLADFDPQCMPPLLAADRWMLARCDETLQKARAALNDYEIGAARHEIDKLFWHDFCDCYIELAKDRLYSPETRGEAARRSGQYALYHSLLAILRLYAIYVPFITEEIYAQLPQAVGQPASLHQQQWPKPASPDSDLLQLGEILGEALAQARRYQSEHQLPRSAEIPPLTLKIPSALEALFTECEADLLVCTHSEGIIRR